jgi:hypothetical protein
MQYSDIGIVPETRIYLDVYGNCRKYILPHKTKPMPLDTLHYAQDCIHLVDRTRGILYTEVITEDTLGGSHVVVSFAQRVGQVESSECCEKSPCTDITYLARLKISYTQLN